MTRQFWALIGLCVFVFAISQFNQQAALGDFDDDDFGVYSHHYFPGYSVYSAYPRTYAYPSYYGGAYYSGSYAYPSYYSGAYSYPSYYSRYYSYPSYYPHYSSGYFPRYSGYSSFGYGGGYWGGFYPY